MLVHRMVPPLLLSLTMTQAPAFAQSAPSQMPLRPVTPMSGTATSDGSYPGHEPMSNRASNIDTSDTHTVYAPELPAPPIGADATPRDLVMAAQQALAKQQTGAAQQALEMAETRLLTRTVPAGSGSVPDSSPMVAQIQHALHLLGHGDTAGATQVLSTALASQ